MPKLTSAQCLACVREPDPSKPTPPLAKRHRLIRRAITYTLVAILQQTLAAASFLATLSPVVNWTASASLVTGDIDSDGLPDIISVNSQLSSIDVFLNQGHGRFIKTPDVLY